MTVVAALAEDALSIVANAKILLNGSTVQFDADGAGAGAPVDIGTFAGGTSGDPLVVTFTTTDATPAAVTALVQSIAYRDTNGGDPNTTDRTVRFTVNDGDGATSSNNDATVHITPVNDVPVFAGLDASHTINEGDAVGLDDNATVSDPELDAANNYDGAVLTLQRQGSADASDVFGDGGGTVDLTGGGDVLVGGVDVGDFTQVAGVLSITFDPDATSARVDEVLQQLTYANTDDTPPAQVVIAYAFSDGNTGGQGTGDAGTADGTVTVNITAVNDPATITGDAAGDVTEAGGVNNGTAGTPTDTGDLDSTDVDNANDAWQAVAAGTGPSVASAATA